MSICKSKVRALNLIMIVNHFLARSQLTTLLKIHIFDHDIHAKNTEQICLFFSQRKQNSQ